MQLLVVKHTFTPTYTPQGNTVERLHSVLKAMLRSDSNPDPWTRKLPVAVFAINTAMCRSIGLTPFEATFGRNARLPLDLVIPPPTETAVMSIHDYTRGLEDRFRRIYTELRNNQALSIARETERDLERFKGDTFHVGDLVFYFSSKAIRGVARSLIHPRIGPFEVH